MGGRRRKAKGSILIFDSAVKRVLPRRKKSELESGDFP